MEIDEKDKQSVVNASTDSMVYYNKASFFDNISTGEDSSNKRYKKENITLVACIFIFST